MVVKDIIILNMKNKKIRLSHVMVEFFIIGHFFIPNNDCGEGGKTCGTIAKMKNYQEKRKGRSGYNV
ncbi:hypothetical protein COL83_29780 [Bacillus wiedmannii]|nr:hypothetical protein COL83_29780 [Bacillus wiedmannii]